MTKRTFAFSLLFSLSVFVLTAISQNKKDDRLPSQTHKFATLIYETFDGSASLPAGWSVSPDSIGGYFTWAVTTPYNPSSPPAPSIPNTATFQSYNLSAGSVARLITPTLDWSAASVPLCKFQFRRDTQYPSYLDSLYVDISTDGGSSWIELAGFKRSLTPPPFTTYFEEKTVNVAPYGGYSSVIFAFRGVSKNGNWIHIDNVFIGQEIVNDVGVSAITSPFSGNIFRTPQTFAVTISNLGSGNQSAGDYYVHARVWRTYEYPSGTPVFDQVESGPAVTGKGSAPYIFATQWIPTELGDYIIQIQTELITDELPSNDASAPRSVAVVPVVDITVTSIIYPMAAGLYTGTLGYSVKAAVKNNGVDTVHGSEYLAEAWIGPTAGFPGNATFHNFAAFKADLPPYQTREVTINANWVPTDTGKHTVRFVVLLGGDENETNDTCDVQRVVNGPYHGGPDDGGYYYATSLFTGTNKPTFEWIDITSVGIPLTLTDDGTSLPITIPPFLMYDSIQTQIKINANGFLTFDMDWNGSGSASNKSIPNKIKPDGIIAAFWDDLNPAAPEAGQIYFYDDTTTYRFIVEYVNIPILGDTGRNTFEIILNYEENSYKANTILFQYLKTPGNESASTIGIENVSGTIGTQYLFDGNPSVRLDENFPDSLAILFGKDLSKGEASASMNVALGWNMISIPVITPEKQKSILFPTASSEAFAFQGGYSAQETLSCGIGYWLKFPSSQTITLTGEPRLVDTLDVVAGWNMIGSITTPVNVADISSFPPNILASQFFSYQAGYNSEDTLNPGKGYWVKVDTDGKLFLTSNTSSLTRYNPSIKKMLFSK
ncbi:MAG: choice-of-anchor J domain-containing protein [Ignavibacteriae bacterium]|nr:choice-of-anchor J domain-containing protein [Ignavibacteriota bacterium]